jgi:hypothetical protein
VAIQVTSMCEVPKNKTTEYNVITTELAFATSVLKTITSAFDFTLDLNLKIFGSQLLRTKTIVLKNHD